MLSYIQKGKLITQFAKKINRIQVERVIAASGGLSDKINNPTNAISLVPMPAIDIGNRAIKPAAAIAQETNMKLYLIPVAQKIK